VQPFRKSSRVNGVSSIVGTVMHFQKLGGNVNEHGLLMCELTLGYNLAEFCTCFFVSAIGNTIGDIKEDGCSVTIFNFSITM